MRREDSARWGARAEPFADLVPGGAAPLTRAGADALFMETHPDPPKARCDASSQYPLDRMEKVLDEARRISEIVRPVAG